MKTRSSGPSSRPPLSGVRGIAPSAPGLMVPVDLSTSRTRTLPVESWMPKAPSTSRKRSGETEPRAGERHRREPVTERARQPRARAPSTRPQRTARPTKTVSGTHAGPAWPKPQVTRRAPRQHDSGDHEERQHVATGRQPGQQPDRERHQRTDALGEEPHPAHRVRQVGHGEADQAGSRASSSVTPSCHRSRSSSSAASTTPSPSARTRWETADGLMPSSSAMSCCRRAPQQTIQHRHRPLRQAGDDLVPQHQARR